MNMDITLGNAVRSIAWGIFFILVVAGVWYGLHPARPAALPNVSAEDLMNVPVARPIAAYANKGDYELAFQAYTAIINSATATPALIAQAEISGAYISYRASGEFSSAIKSIQALKDVVANLGLSPYVRAKAVLRIALWYPISNYDLDIFAEIFKDNPYRTYLTQPDTRVGRRASVRQLMLWSYQLVPLYRTAIAISKLYAEEAVQDPHAASTPANIDAAEKYLAYSEDLVAKDPASDTPEHISERASYLYDRAYTIGILASLKSLAEQAHYKQAYEDIFSFFEKTDAVQDRGDLALTHWKYATLLLSVDQDVQKTRAQLKQAVDLALADPHFQTNSLVSTIRSIKQRNTISGTQLLNQLSEDSPEFKAFASSIK